MKLIKCERCGVCCLTGPCKKGNEDNKGICSHLYFEDNIAFCRLFVEDKVQPKDIGIGAGCVLRQLPAIFEYHFKQTENYKSYVFNTCS